MTERRDSTVQAAVVDLATSSASAPTWREIELAAGRRQTAVEPVARRRMPVWAVAVTAVVVAAASIGGTLLFLSGGDDVAETPLTTAIPPATTVLTPDTSAVQALLDQYYAAYNAGDADAAGGLLSSVIREVSPGSLRYWVGALGEEVDAVCTPSTSHPDGIRCIETYTDDLHGPPGLFSVAQYLYFERNGRLQQTGDPVVTADMRPGCYEQRCVGAGYQEYEADLFTWLEAEHPDVALIVGDAAALGYFSNNATAAAAALPFVEEFLAQSDEWGGSDPGSGFAGMTVIEAVDAKFAALNAVDAAAYEAVLGEPPDEVMEWLWAMETSWAVTCEPAGDPATARCDIEVFDSFYTRAGAVFQSTSLFTLRNGRLTETVEQESTSFQWAYFAFENTFVDWLRTAHPNDSTVAGDGSWLARTAEAGAIAVQYVDEFLNQTDEYPRDPGAIDN